jgi:hypothetical protein
MQLVAVHVGELHRALDQGHVVAALALALGDLGHALVVRLHARVDRGVAVGDDLLQQEPRVRGEALAFVDEQRDEPIEALSRAVELVVDPDVVRADHQQDDVGLLDGIEDARHDVDEPLALRRARLDDAAAPALVMLLGGRQPPRVVRLGADELEGRARLREQLGQHRTVARVGAARADGDGVAKRQDAQRPRRAGRARQAPVAEAGGDEHERGDREHEPPSRAAPFLRHRGAG